MYVYIYIYIYSLGSRAHPVNEQTKLGGAVRGGRGNKQRNNRLVTRQQARQHATKVVSN